MSSSAPLPPATRTSRPRVVVAAGTIGNTRTHRDWSAKGLMNTTRRRRVFAPTCAEPKSTTRALRAVRAFSGEFDFDASDTPDAGVVAAGTFAGPVPVPVPVRDSLPEVSERSRSGPEGDPKTGDFFVSSPAPSSSSSSSSSSTNASMSSFANSSSSSPEKSSILGRISFVRTRTRTSSTASVRTVRMDSTVALEAACGSSPPATRAHASRARVISSTSAEESAGAAGTARAPSGCLFCGANRRAESAPNPKKEAAKPRTVSKERLQKPLFAPSRAASYPVSRGESWEDACAGRRLSFVAPARLLRAKPVYARSASMAAGSNTTSPTTTRFPGLSFFSESSRRTAGSEEANPKTVTASANELCSVSDARVLRPGNAAGTSSVASASVTSPPATFLTTLARPFPSAATATSPRSARSTTGATRTLPLSSVNESMPPMRAISSSSGAASTSIVATWSGGMTTADETNFFASRTSSRMSPASAPFALVSERSSRLAKLCTHAAIFPRSVRHPSGGGSGRNGGVFRVANSDWSAETEEGAMGALSGAAETSTRVTRAARTVLVTDSIATATGLGLRTATRRTFVSPTRVTPKSITPMMDKPSFSRYFPSETAQGTAISVSRDSSELFALVARSSVSSPASGEGLAGVTVEYALEAAAAAAAARVAACAASKHASCPWYTRSGTWSVVRFVSSSRRASKSAATARGSYSISSDRTASPGRTTCVASNDDETTRRQHAASFFSFSFSFVEETSSPPERSEKASSTTTRAPKTASGTGKPLVTENVLRCFWNGARPTSGDAKLASSTSNSSLPCTTRARYETSKGGSPESVCTNSEPTRNPSSFPLYVSAIASRALVNAGKTPSAKPFSSLALNDGSLGRVSICVTFVEREAPLNSER